MTTSQLLSANGLVMPDDFPIAPYESIHGALASFASKNREVYAEFAGGWNAISIRFLGMVHFGNTFTTSIKTHGPAPAPEMRYEQERDLFGFFSNGFSIFEAYFYSIYAIGAFLQPSQFPITTPADQRRITPKSTTNAYTAAFPNDAIVTAFSAVLGDSAYKEWQEIRNILTHRSVPGRAFFLSIGESDEPTAQWKLRNIPLDENTTTIRRHDAARLLSAALSATQPFVSSRLR